MTINTHTMKLVAADRIADLRRDPASPPKRTAKPTPALGIKRAPGHRLGVTAIRMEDR